MHPMHIRSPRTLMVAGLLALGIATLAGCSQSPTSATSPVSTRAQAEASGVNPDNRWTEPPPEPVSPVPAPTPAPATGAAGSRTIDPLFGGTVSAGQFRVVIPPAALRQTAVVTVRQPRLDQRVVQLEISPASANGFLVPVLLIADCSDMSLNLLSLQTIFWWNPTLQRWEAVLNVQVNLLGHSLTAPLWHFSTYKVGGKAGW